MNKFEVLWERVLQVIPFFNRVEFLQTEDVTKLYDSVDQVLHW